RVSTCSISVACEPAIFNLDIAALGPAELAEAFPKRGNAGLSFRIAFRKRRQHADSPHSLALLRARRERPCDRRTAEQRDELAPFDHSITSSASASSLSGIWRPSALAVLRLMTNSSFVACMTGRSAGCSPLRMRPV